MKGIRVYFDEIKNAWVHNWDNRIFKSHMAVTLLFYILFLHFGIRYISLMELRHGRILADPVLENLPPHDFSFLIFSFIHTGILITAIRLFSTPSKFILALQAILAILLLRTCSIYLLPLEPPPGMILLKDPFISFVFGSTTKVAVKDLFFSGHVATMCALVYFSRPDYWKAYLSVATVIVAILIAWQHVHYSIDLVAAPVFGFACCLAVDHLHERWDYGLEDSFYLTGKDTQATLQ